MTKAKDFTTLMEERFGENLDSVFIEYGNKDEVITAISTGSLSLDASIGVGGIPRRRYTVLDGLEGLGKSTVAVSIAKNCIGGGGKVIYIDVENQMTFDYLDLLLGAGHIGKDFILAKPDTSDDAFIIAEMAIKSKEFDLIVLDSVGALAPTEEKEKKFEGDSMAIIPRDIGKFLRRNTYNLRVNNIAFLFINQLRDAVGSYVKAYTSPGGHALKYFASVMITLNKSSAPELQIKVGEDKIGSFVPFIIKKNKVGMPFRAGSIPIIPGIGIDGLRDTIEFCKMLGVIQMGGPYYKFEGENIGKGFENTLENLKNAPELLERIKTKVYSIISKVKTVDEEA
jgi:recombination protein RecA